MLEFILILINLYLINQILINFKIKSVLSVFHSFLSIHWILGYSTIYFLFSYLKPRYDFIHFDIHGSIEILILIIIYGLFLCCLPFIFKSRFVFKTKKVLFINKTSSILVLTLIIFSFYFGYLINVFGVGLDITSLPFRLNGLLEEILTFGISLYLFAIIKNRLVLFLSVILYSLTNLYLYGSKFYSLLPVLIILILNIFLESGSYKVLKRLIFFITLFFLFFYSFLNPFKFRTDIAESNENGIVDSFVENVSTTNLSDIPFFDVVAIGVINFGYRLSGYETLTNAKFVISKSNRVITTDPHKTLNLFMDNEIGTSSSTGFIGFFQIMFNSMFFGLFFALFVLFILFYFFSLGIFQKFLISEIFFINYLQAFIDGPYFEGLFIKFLFNCLFVFIFFKLKTSKVIG